jgi:chaperonin GroES
MKLKPLYDRVIVKLDPPETKKGSLFIPDNAQDKPQTGRVLAVGLGTRYKSGELIPLSVKEGDRILVGKWSGTEVKVEGEEILIVQEKEIIGILD